MAEETTETTTLAAEPPTIPTPTPEQQGEQPDGQSQELILGKFKTQADLEKAYTELQTRLGKGSNQQGSEPVAAPPGIQIQPNTPAQDATISDALARAGLNEEQMATEWQANSGKLDDGTYQALFNSGGYSRPQIDQVMSGSVARAELRQIQMNTSISTVQNMMGGEPQLNNLLAWAGTNMPAPEVEAMNQRLNDPGQVESVVRSLRDRHRDSVGAGESQPLVQGGVAPPAAGSGGPKNMADFVKLRNAAKNGDQAAINSLARLNPADLANFV